MLDEAPNRGAWYGCWLAIVCNRCGFHFQLTLVTKDTFGVQGRAAQALAVYRERVRQLSQPKPDVTAYNELRQQWTPPLNHGHIPGVPVGARLRGRGEAAIVGIHTHMMRGIDSRHGVTLRTVCQGVM
jgi:hypothetical protein